MRETLEKINHTNSNEGQEFQHVFTSIYSSQQDGE